MHPASTPLAPESTLHAPLSTGELLDKISILQIKATRMQDPVQLRHVQQELDALQTVAQQAQLSAGTWALLEPLRAVNTRLWDIEDAIRHCERQQDFGPQFVAWARSVYRTNDERAAIKRQINHISGSPLFEEKSYAAY